MGDSNGKYLTGTDEPRIFDPATPIVPPVDNAWRWWFAAILLMQAAFLLNFNYHHSGFRTELDENAKLIRQLQERIIVKDLANLRKGTP